MVSEILDKLVNNPFFDYLDSMISPYINSLKPLVLPYINELKDFQFHIVNPLFWVLFVVAIFFFHCLWNFKKAFFYCLITATILLITTAVEHSMSDTLAKSPLFDYMIVRYIAIFLIMLVSVYFLFIKSD